MWFAVAALLLGWAFVYVSRPREPAVITPEEVAKQEKCLESVPLKEQTSATEEEETTEAKKVVGEEEKEEEAPEEPRHDPPKKEPPTLEDWMQPVPDVERHNRKRQARQNGTFNELLSSVEFANWVAKDKQTLLCLGFPGTGKSILASAVIDYLEEKRDGDKDLAVGFLYCESGEKPVDLLWRLLKQFVQQSQKPIPEMVQLFYRCYRLQRPPRLDIDNTSKALQIMTMDYRKTFVVIDGLDECEASKNFHIFLSKILALQETTKINFLVLSRPVNNIEYRLQDCPSWTVRAPREDIRLYLEENLVEIPDAGLRDEVVSEIINNYNGVFLFAHLHFKILTTVRSTDELNMILARPSSLQPKQHTEDGIRAYLAELCSYAVERIKQLDPRSRHLAERTLMWLSCSMAPLRFSDIISFWTAEIHTSDRYGDVRPVNEISSLCAGLVVIDEERLSVSFHHRMVREHFQQNWNIYFPDAHEVIARACIAHLRANSHNIAKYADGNKDELPVWQGFTVYAAKNWGHHARLASEESTKTQALEFLRDTPAVADSYHVMDLYSVSGSVSHDQPLGMHLAAYFGLEEAIADLLKDGNDVNTNDPSGKTPLLWASEMGYLTIVALLLNESGIQIECKDAESGRTPLIWSAKHGHYRTVEELLDHGADIESKDERFSQTALSWAVKNGQHEVAELLLQRGAQIPLAAENDISPFLFLGAAEGCHEAFVQQYLAQSPLLSAAWNGREDLMLLLLENGYNVYTRDKTFRQTALAWAAMNGKHAVVELLLEKGASADTFDHFESVPLHYAALYGHKTVMKILLERGADINTRCNWYNYTPLSLATWTGRFDVVQLLLDQGADLQLGAPFEWALDTGPELQLRFMIGIGEHMQDPREENVKELQEMDPGDEHLKVLTLLLMGRFDLTADDIHQMMIMLFYDRLPILWGVLSRQNEMLKMLVEKGALDPLEQDEGSDISVLGMAAEKGVDTLVRVLIEQGADIECRNTSIGKTPLHLAAENGHERVVKLLLERGADIEAQDILFGQTPLLWAAEKGHLAVVELFLNEGAEIEAKEDEYSRTALLLAARNGHVEVVRRLIQRGANAACKDTEHLLTALGWAKRNGYEDVEKLLTEQTDGGSCP